MRAKLNWMIEFLLGEFGQSSSRRQRIVRKPIVHQCVGPDERLVSQ